MIGIVKGDGDVVSLHMTAKMAKRLLRSARIEMVDALDVAIEAKQEDRVDRIRAEYEAVRNAMSKLEEIEYDCQ